MGFDTIEINLVFLYKTFSQNEHYERLYKFLLVPSSFLEAVASLGLVVSLSQSVSQSVTF